MLEAGTGESGQLSCSCSEWGVKQVWVTFESKVPRALPTTLPAHYHPFSGNDPSLAELWLSQLLFLSVGQRYQLFWASWQMLTSAL